MSRVRCGIRGCPHWIREGLRERTHDYRFANVKEQPDGYRCWRCRDGRRGHLKESRKEDKP